MKVTAFIRETSAKNNITDQAHVYFRVRDGKTDIKAVSELSINPNHWSAERQGYKTRGSCSGGKTHGIRQGRAGLDGAYIRTILSWSGQPLAKRCY